MNPEGHLVTPLGKQHDRAAFFCGELSLDTYLSAQAGQDRWRDLARCFVLTTPGDPQRILGYYTLSAHSVSMHDLPDDLTRRVPSPALPAVLIGRLAISRAQQGRGLGALLLASAVQHCAHLADELGLAVIVVDALSEPAAAFYERFGFNRLGGGERLFLNVRFARASGR